MGHGMRRMLLKSPKKTTKGEKKNKKLFGKVAATDTEKNENHKFSHISKRPQE